MSRTPLILLGISLAGAACERPTTAPATGAAARSVLRLQSADAAGLVRTTWPSAENPGPPYYARIEPTTPHIPIVNNWAVVAFYRDPACIRPDFNLLVFFDAPAAFGCPLEVEGFNLSQSGVSAGPPKIAQSQGTGVPFWFVPADAALEAMEDGVLTIGELSALPGLVVGSADSFEEVLQPFGGTAPIPKLSQSAQGALTDGRAFEYHVVTLNGEVQAIELHFE